MPSGKFVAGSTDCSAAFPARKRTTENGLGRNGWCGDHMLPVVLETRRWPDERSSQAGRHPDRQGRVRPARFWLPVMAIWAGSMRPAQRGRRCSRSIPTYPPGIPSQSVARQEPREFRVGGERALQGGLVKLRARGAPGLSPSAAAPIDRQPPPWEPASRSSVDAHCLWGVEYG
jgi:hypothetical protein